ASSAAPPSARSASARSSARAEPSCPAADAFGVAREAASELVAANLRIALDRLGEVAGAIPPDDVLGRLFARFCIGK
ncbi:MAG: tRNA uridine-5-carboxymethylaminomethyl(34) synthesis GTPase MnmE, partial [Phycisphaerales bacterium]